MGYRAAPPGQGRPRWHRLRPGRAALRQPHPRHQKHHLQERIAWSPLRPVAGGLILIAMTLLVGTTDYNGLGLPLIQSSVAGQGVFPFAFLLKIVFTAVTLGSGFLGGESLRCLYRRGPRLNRRRGPRLRSRPDGVCWLCRGLRWRQQYLLACALMGIELFGGGGAALYLLVLAVSSLTSSAVSAAYTPPSASTLKMDAPQSPLIIPPAGRPHRRIPPLASPSLPPRLRQAAASPPAPINPPHFTLLTSFLLSHFFLFFSPLRSEVEKRLFFALRTAAPG
ncbi:MAG: chloride channel protein [Chloroflexi bacterium]|nr:chloride channel protein [Chloroflexota bacterium]